MFTHILVPLDGSTLAECVIPHVISLAAALDAHVTLMHVLERPHDTGQVQPVDPVMWSLKKHEAGTYLDRIYDRLQEAGLPAEKVLQEGVAAECIINYANSNAVDLIVLSTHGSSGLSAWNVSSVVQKIIVRANKSTLLVRAYSTSAVKAEEIHYNRLFIGLDCSARAELVLPVAIRLANHYNASLILGTVIQKPEILSRFPLSEEDARIINQIAERNQKTASHYLDQLNIQLSQSGIGLKTSLAVSENQIASLHAMVEEEKADMVMIVAHGHSGQGRWPYGSVATSFIAYGTTSLFIMQDLSAGDIQTSKAEMATLETQGH